MCRRDFLNDDGVIGSEPTLPVSYEKPNPYLFVALAVTSQQRNGFVVEHHLSSRLDGEQFSATQGASARELGFRGLHATESGGERPLKLPCTCGGGGGRDDCIRLEQSQVQHTM